MLLHLFCPSTAPLLTSNVSAFRRIENMPAIGRFSGFTHPKLTQVRQYPIKGFKNYLIFYPIHDDAIEVLRVLQGSQDLQTILEQEFTE
jgi:toxin ParE1/3/4